LAGGGDSGSSVLSAIECSDDSLTELAAVPLFIWHYQAGMLHNAAMGKLYYRWGDGGGGIGVIDEATHKVIKHIYLPGPNGIWGRTYSQASGKLYCQMVGRLAVIDGSGDSLLEVLNFGGRGVHAPIWYPDSNWLYDVSRVGGQYFISVVDCRTDSVLKDLPVGSSDYSLDLIGKSRLVCYGSPVGPAHTILVDCRTNTVLAESALSGHVQAQANDGSDKIYFVRLFRLEVRSASDLSLLDTICWSYGRNQWAQVLLCSDSARRLYWFAGDSVLVVDTKNDSVVCSLLGTGERYAEFACLDGTLRYVFLSADRSLVVYDAKLDSIVARLVTAEDPGPVAANPELGLIYAGLSDRIQVYSSVPPAVEDAPAAAAERHMETILRAPAAAKFGSAAWFDVTGRRVTTTSRGAVPCVLGAGVYISPGTDRAGPKVIVVR
jgi:hypothetical protein